MKEVTYFIMALTLLSGVASANGAELGVKSASTVLTTLSGGTATGSLMLVNCGTNNLTFKLSAHSSQLEYIPQADGDRWVDLAINDHAVELVFTNRPNELSGSIALPFGFPFYKSVYTNVFVGENGGVALGSAEAIGPDCQAFPTTNAPPVFVAPYWGSLDYLPDQSHVYYLAESNRFIVTYYQMHNDNYPGAWQTFQVIFFDRGQLSFRYDGTTGFDRVIRGVQDRNNGQEMNLWSSTNQSTASIRLNPDFYTVITNASYSWVSGGTAVTLRDPDPSPYVTVNDSGNSDVLPIGFEFPFYGTTYTNFRVCVDGAILLGRTNFVYGSFKVPDQNRPYPLIVPFGLEWLKMTNGSSIVYKNTTDALIVTYNNIWMLPLSGIGLNGGFQTFQVIMEKDGDVTFQYNTLNGDLGISLMEASVGMQDYAPGLWDLPPPEFKLTNTMDRFAIRFAANKREWLSVSPAQGTIPVNRFTNIIVTGSSAGFVAGQTYEGEVLVTHNASNYSSPLQQSITMHVLQNPGPVLTAGKLRYDPVNCYRADRIGPGDRVNLYVVLENNGSGNAVGVTATLNNATYFSVSSNTHTYGEIASNGEAVNDQPYILRVSSNCPAGLYPLALTIHADSANSWSDTVQIQVQPTPVPALPQEPLTVFAQKGRDATTSLVVSNSGNGPLTFSIDDLFKPTNYVWQANTNGSLAYNWVDLKSSYSGNTVSFHDPDPDSPYQDANNCGYSDPINIGFRFPFWGEEYDRMVVHVGGVLTLDPLTNAFPGSSQWNDIQGSFLAAYWPMGGRGGLKIDSNAVVKYKSYADKIVISWLNLFESALIDGPDQNFQVILHKDGTITYQYQTITGSWWKNAKIGVKSASGLYNTASLLRASDMTSVTNQYGGVSATYSTNIANRMIEFKPGIVDWIAPFSVTSGTLQPHQSLTLSITCTAAKLDAGSYQGDILFTYQEGLVKVPVLFVVSE